MIIKYVTINVQYIYYFIRIRIVSVSMTIMIIPKRGTRTNFLFP